ncbi:hypothetical protein [Cetobacterium sp. ZOR0034]|uniref:hypothetical protein n=1 Tax=Cetobacterium sp. ZOR0034 TaxID=1339239 RepID=UPI0006458A09|nr:hypothetical protein [Cetobacterium sp. ZOR0034]
MKEFLITNQGILIPLGTLLVGYFIPNDTLYNIGFKTRKRIPKDLRKLISDKISYLAKGIYEADYRGDKNLIDNNTVKKIIDKTEIDLGLEQK